MLKYDNDIKTLIWAMSEPQRSNFSDFMKNMKNTGLDDKLKDDLMCDVIINEIHSVSLYEKQNKDKEHAASKGETKVHPNKFGVHRTHCCKYHGCKYGDIDCPVVVEIIVQEYPCEDCGHEEDDDNKFKKI